ncbi:hypothetical protein L7F22_049696 [Adiantum nelumboides]|nr:hypothetical protein [Adiantum nelumboides]
MSTPATPHERSRARLANLVLKSGSLLISSKGLGWKSWKRRWFVLTHTSLVFYKSDPTASSKGGESILALGGIDLNSSGRVLVKADKKLLTVLFPDGRAFTLKAETTEDLEDWKDSLERAISAAPSPDVIMGHSGIFKTDSIDATIEPVDIGRSRKPVKSMVVGRPILLALEDIDGSPSFLEKALSFIEQHGVGVEGILRQSADVDEVEQRVRDYEQGKIHFSPDEDAHVIGDCIKHVLRELPSLPVPMPCCSALLEAQRCERKESQVLAMKSAVSETFPEPNRRLLQRVLKMMRTVALHSFENRMTASAVAACMAPLLLKPLLTGECGLEDDSDISGDNSAQLLAAAAAANSAQAIITTLLEEYDRIFEEDLESNRHSPSAYARVEDTASEASSDGEVLQVHDDDYQEVEEEQDQELDEDPERLLSGSMSESSGNEGSDVYDSKAYEDEDSDDEQHKTSRTSHGRSIKVLSRSVNLANSRGLHEGHMEIGMLSTSTIGLNQSCWNNKFAVGATPRAGVSNYISGTSSIRTVGTPTVTSSSRRSSLWGLSATKKTPEAVLSGDEELVIQRLEATRNDLRNKIAKEAKGNAALQQSLERRKQALHDRRMVLEQDVTRLQEQLQAERELRAALEIGLSMSASQFPLTRKLDAKTRVEFEEIAVAEADVASLKQRVAELHAQLSQHRQQNNSSAPEKHERHQWAREQQNVLHQELCDQEGQGQYTKEGQNRHDHTSALEQMMMQQRNALEAAKEVLKVERARGSNLRKQAAQQELTTSNDWRTLRYPVAPLLGSKQFSWRRRHDGSNNLDQTESDVMPPHVNNISSVNDTMQTGKRNFADVEKASAAAMYQRPQVTSTALAELTSRLDFFKEKRSQLVEQLQSLDSSLTPSHDMLCSSSPPWTTRPG